MAVEADGGREVWLLASGVSPADRAASTSELLTGQDRQALCEVLGRFAARLLEQLHRLAVSAQVDVVLVVHGAERRAFAYEALLRQERSRIGLMPDVRQLANRWVLGPSIVARRRPVVEVFDGLVWRAATGTLVPFFGAGVSAASGAPAWRTLLDAIGAEADEGLEQRGVDRRVVRGLDAYDRAQLYARVLGDERPYGLLREQLGAVTPSLQHQLLAALQPRDAVTTNYDTAYEQAVADAGYGRVAAIPSSAARLPLLKVHGTVSAGQEPGSMLAPVLTREHLLDHQLLAGPLRGALQMMLITGHVMFLGYGLGDAHLNEAINQVRRIREQARPARQGERRAASGPAVAGRAAAQGPDERAGATADAADGSQAPAAAEQDDLAALATAIQVVPDESLSLVWSPHVEVIWPVAAQAQGPADAAAEQPGPVATRDLEVLLDVLADAANLAVVPVLAFDDAELDESERQLKQRLDLLRGYFPDSQPLPDPVAALLSAHGARDLPGW